MSDRTDILTLARLEEDRLVRELRETTPLFRKLEAVRAVIGTYGAILPETRVGTVVSPSGHPPRRNSKASLSAIVVKGAREYLSSVGHRAESNEIVEGLRRQGTEIDRPNPAGVVSSYLSQSSLFDNVRGQGYGLVEWTTKSSSTNGASAPVQNLSDLNDSSGAASETSS